MPPWTLSDPFRDFEGAEDTLRAITAKQGVGVTGEELTFYVFYSYLPAGNYAECCSYLPAAFHYLRTAEVRQGSCLIQLWENLFHVWMAQFSHELRRDRRMMDVLAQMYSIFDARLELWLSGDNSSAMACMMEEWTLMLLCSAPVAEVYKKLPETLLHGNIHARMLFLALHPVSEPSFPHMSERYADCYVSEECVLQRMRQLLPNEQFRSFLDTLQTDVLESSLRGQISQELFEYWSNNLECADDASAHYPGGPACV